jgi:transposase-like protein
MLSPHSPPVSSLSKQEGISEPTLYNWRKQLRQIGRLVKYRIFHARFLYGYVTLDGQPYEKSSISSDRFGL